MAYEGGYPAQRPYPGPGAQRPGPPLEAYQQGPPQHYDAPQQQYDGYQDNYAYDQYDNGGYGQNYGGQHHHDQGYGPISPDTVGGFGGAFPVFPGHQRRADFEQESDMISQMAGMDIAGPRNGPPPGGGGAQRNQMRSPEGDYGRPPMDARGPPRGYQQYENSRRGPAPAPQFGAKYRDDAYGAPPPANEFGPPGRSMTMPTNRPTEGSHHQQGQRHRKVTGHRLNACTRRFKKSRSLRGATEATTTATRAITGAITKK
ncbi:hypothetical protein ACHAP9_002718 [Verticillium nonalfalfae]